MGDCVCVVFWGCFLCLLFKTITCASKFYYFTHTQLSENLWYQRTKSLTQPDLNDHKYVFMCVWSYLCVLFYSDPNKWARNIYLFLCWHFCCGPGVKPALMMSAGHSGRPVGYTGRPVGHTGRPVGWLMSWISPWTPPHSSLLMLPDRHSKNDNAPQQHACSFMLVCVWGCAWLCL